MAKENVALGFNWMMFMVSNVDVQQESLMCCYLTGRGGKGIIFVDRIFFNTFDRANVRNRCMWQNFLGSSSVLDVVQLTFKEEHLKKQYDCNYFS